MQVLDIGRGDYVSAWDLQRRLVRERRLSLIPDTVILAEHRPVYTIGASSRQAPPPGLPLHRVERGGDITYHGPGQLVGYPIVDLRERGVKVREYLRLLEEILIETLERVGLAAERVPALTGVWAQGKKIASIGVAVKSYVTYHGFALNVDMDLAPFRRIHPCRLEPGSLTTLAQALGRPVGLEEVKPLLLAAIERHLTEPAAAS